MQEVEKLFSLCVSISPVFFLFLQKPYVVFAHKCVCNLYLYNCVEDFHFEMNPDIDIFPVLRVKDLFLLFLTPETMLYQTKQNHFVVQHLKTDLTTQIANRQKIQQRVLECFQHFLCISFQILQSLFFHQVLVGPNFRKWSVSDMSFPPNNCTTAPLCFYLEVFH